VCSNRQSPVLPPKKPLQNGGSGGDGGDGVLPGKKTNSHEWQWQWPVAKKKKPVRKKNDMSLKTDRRICLFLDAPFSLNDLDTKSCRIHVYFVFSTTSYSKSIAS